MAAPKTVTCPVCKGAKTIKQGRGGNIRKPIAEKKCTYCSGKGTVKPSRA